MEFHFRETFAYTVLTLLLILPTTHAQQQSTASTIDPQALGVLKQAAAALQGATPVTDVTLSGSARRTAGSDDEVGTVVLKALGAGASRIDMNLPSGQLSEVRNVTAAIPSGNWTGPDGKTHPILFHNLRTEPSWFFPSFGVGRTLSTSLFSLTYVGLENRLGHSVHHVSISRSGSNPGLASVLDTHLSIVDYYFDEKTLLPVALTYDTHPDENAAVDVPVEIQFSDYRPVGTSQVPFRVQHFLNNVLFLDLQIQTVSFNTGLTVTAFAVN
jgi:hypothetical protein